MKKITYRRNYAEARRAEYPDIGDQLGALWSAIEALGTDKLPPEAATLLDRVKAVKARFPKT